MTTLDALLREIGDDIASRNRIINRSRRQSLARQYVAAAKKRGRYPGAIADLLPPDLFREAMADRHDPAITWRILLELRCRIRLLRKSPLSTLPGYESAVVYWHGEFLLYRWQLARLENERDGRSDTAHAIELGGQMFGGM